MGNHICCLTVGNHKETIQLVLSDGTVQILHKPLCVAEIIQEFPQHLVCHSDSFYIGKKTPTLSAKEQLKVGNKYFLLPQTLLSVSLISPIFGFLNIAAAAHKISTYFHSLPISSTSQNRTCFCFLPTV
jgi:hypothetical protein